MQVFSQAPAPALCVHTPGLNPPPAYPMQVFRQTPQLAHQSTAGGETGGRHHKAISNAAGSKFEPFRVMVFAATKRGCDELAWQLRAV